MRTLLQERRITPGEALNHAFVTLSHLVDYAHCNNVKASVQMMEVCRRNAYNSSSSGGHHQSATAAPPLVANFVPSSNGNVTLTFNNNQLPNQVPAVYRGSGHKSLVCEFITFPYGKDQLTRAVVSFLSRLTNKSAGSGIVYCLCVLFFR